MTKNSWMENTNMMIQRKTATLLILILLLALLAGAVPAPPGRNRGSGILNAVFAALCCAEEVGAADLSGEAAPASDKQTQATIDHIQEFLTRKDGVKAEDVIAVVQDAMVPMEQSVYMKADRIAFDTEKRQPRIVGTKCVGCHLCRLVCPTGAIGTTKRIVKK